jgi:GST-like protein
MGRIANNRPIAGPTHDKELPVRRQSLQLYALASPNGVKVTVMRGWGSNTTTGG